jgi:hypothetical protein
MATRLYFRDTTNDLTGTFPAGEQSTLTATYNGSKAASLRKMIKTIGAAQTSSAGTTLNSTALQSGFMAYFVSDPFKIAPSGSGGPITLNVAVLETNNAVNLTTLYWNIYFWRPSTGSLVSTVTESSTTFTEPGQNTEEVWHSQILSDYTISGVNADDVIVCEVWFRHTQAMATSYSTSLYYDGTTVNTTSGSTVTNHASFIEFDYNYSFTTDTRTPRPISIGHPFIF